MKFTFFQLSIDTQKNNNAMGKQVIAKDELKVLGNILNIQNNMVKW